MPRNPPRRAHRVVRATCVATVWIVAILPLPALIDRTSTTVTDRRGYKAVRTTTGALLGYGYGIGLLLFANREFSLRLVGALYAVLRVC